MPELHNSHSNLCLLKAQNELSQSVMLTNVNKVYSISVHGTGMCKVRFLVVGGGGAGYFSGGGSGYIQYGSKTIGHGGIIKANVGDKREASTITISGWTIKAESGKDHKNKKRGGDGYSGGGDHSGSSHGGSNGGKGGGQGGGAGTGEDVTKYVFSIWQLTPGAGGKYYDVCSGGPCGGGGGGILVDGEGPTATEYHGQGYGAGASGSSTINHGGSGLQGVILLETIST